MGPRKQGNRSVEATKQASLMQKSTADNLTAMQLKVLQLQKIVGNRAMQAYVQKQAVQRAKSNQNPIQAKMGFEFETDNRVKKMVKNKWVDFGRKKGDAMYIEPDQFAVEADTHFNPEFIFYPQDNLDSLLTAADNAVDFCESVNNKDGDKIFDKETDPGWTDKFLLDVKDPSWAADAQMTQGVRLQDLPRYIGDTLSLAEKKKYEERAEEVEDTVSGSDPAVQGLLHLLIQFVAEFQEWDGSNNEEGPKNAQSYMSRNSYDKMYKSMSQAQRNEFKGHFYDEESNWIGENPITQATAVSGDERVIKKKYLDRDEHSVDNKKTVKEWIASITDSERAEPDHMSPPQGWRGGNYGMGALDMDTTSVDEESLALFEYRKTDNHPETELSGKSLPMYSWGVWIEEQYKKAVKWNDTLTKPEEEA